MKKIYICFLLIIVSYNLFAQKVLIHTLSGHNLGITSVCYNFNGQYILSSSLDATAILWNAQTGQKTRSFESDNLILDANFSKDGSYIVLASSSVAQIRNALSCSNVKKIGEDLLNVSSVAFSPDKNYIVTGSHDNKVSVWETATGQHIWTSKHKDKVNSVCFSPDGQYVLSGSDDKCAKLWNAQNGEMIREYRRYSSALWSVRFSNDGKFFVSGCGEWGNKSTELYVWEVETGKIIQSFIGHKNIVSSVAFSPDGKYIASGSWDKTAKIWNIKTGATIRTFLIGETISSIDISPDGKHIVTGTSDGKVKIWLTGL